MNLTDVLLTEGRVLHSREELDRDELILPEGAFKIVKKSPLDLTITNKGKKVLEFRGKMSMTAEIPCARCLKMVPTDIVLDFCEEADLKLSDDERAAALDECDFLHGYNLDVDKLVYGEALLVWPMRVLCREDCRGLCRICGQNLNERQCSCDRTDLDPRMAKIRDIFRNVKEV